MGEGGERRGRKEGKRGDVFQRDNGYFLNFRFSMEGKIEATTGQAAYLDNMYIRETI